MDQAQARWVQAHDALALLAELDFDERLELLQDGYRHQLVRLVRDLVTREKRTLHPQIETLTLEELNNLLDIGVCEHHALADELFEGAVFDALVRQPEVFNERALVLLDVLRVQLVNRVTLDLFVDVLQRAEHIWPEGFRVVREQTIAKNLVHKAG